MSMGSEIVDGVKGGCILIVLATIILTILGWEGLKFLLRHLHVGWA